MSAAEDAARLRAAHDALAAELSARDSVTWARRAIQTGFAAILAGGVSFRLAFDRWFSTKATAFKGRPVYFFAALAVTLLLLVLAARWAARARRLSRAEEARFAELLALRAKLGLDP